MMFDEGDWTHDDFFARSHTAIHGTSARMVANAFVASLGSRRLELRSALGSYAVFRHAPEHDLPGAKGKCSICGIQGDRRLGVQDVNVLNFERYQWGGVRHDEDIYATVDLEWFSRLPPIIPGKPDVEMLRDLLTSLRTIPKKVSAAQVHRHFPKSIPSSKQERNVLVAILGFSGVLNTGIHPSYLFAFVPEDEREDPARASEMSYPACWWDSTMGLDDEAIDHWFGHLW